MNGVDRERLSPVMKTETEVSDGEKEHPQSLWLPVPDLPEAAPTLEFHETPLEIYSKVPLSS